MCNTNLKCAIIQSGRKGYQIAHELQWHPSKISQIVIGVHNPTADEKRQLAEVIGRTVGELFPVQMEVV
jgi:plasmid maintenance system antidote protein VapI